MKNIVKVSLWGTIVGYLGYEPGQNSIATFEYDPDFSRSGIQLSPVVMPCPPLVHTFDSISVNTFKGLPGIFSDSLPDSWGNNLIDMYFAQKGISPDAITALDRLLYVGKRGMGGFEYEIERDFESNAKTSVLLDISSLAELAALVTERDEKKRNTLLKANLGEALRLIKVGSSAGGARSKALVALGASGSIFDGTLSDEECKKISVNLLCILKFDSSGNKDRDHQDPEGMTKVEYVYSCIARNCGIAVPPVNYIVDGTFFHFLIERFDRRIENGTIQKIHFSSWAALSHADRDRTGSYSYEQLVLLSRSLALGENEIQEIYRRAVFNILGRNQDDHTKNFAFIMERDGSWKLSPAFDLTWSFDPHGKWTRTHQIRLNGKQDDFTRDDLLIFGRYCNLSETKAQGIIADVRAAFSDFPRLAREVDVPKELMHRVIETQRLFV